MIVFFSNNPFSFFKKNVLIQLNVHCYRKIVRNREQTRQRIPTHWFIIQITRPEQGQSQEPKALIASLMCVAEARALRPTSTAFPTLLVGSRIGNGAAGTQIGTHLGCWHHRLWLYLLYLNDRASNIFFLIFLNEFVEHNPIQHNGPIFNRWYMASSLSSNCPKTSITNWLIQKSHLP